MGSNVYIATSGAIARLHDLDVLANNLANATTTGFKRDNPVFESVLQSSLLDVNGEPQPGAPGRSFVQASEVAIDHTAGSASKTGRVLDVAIDGPGFFEVETPGGSKFTRAGSFIVNQEGNLATPEGFAILADGAPIAVGESGAQIRESGQVVDSGGGVVGQLSVVEFEDESQLRKAGDSFFEAVPGITPQPRTEPRLLVGFVEASNVSAMREMTRLVMVQRAFDSNIRALRADDQATERLIREIGR